MPKTLSDILLLEPGGEIRIGDGAPGINFTGLRIYRTSTGLGFETYENNEIKQWIDEHGILRTVGGLSGEVSVAISQVQEDLLKGDNIWEGLNQFLQKITLGAASGIESEDLVESTLDGFSGSGFMLRKINDKWVLFVDRLLAKNMEVQTLLFMETRTFNGSVAIARTGTGKPKQMTEILL